MDEINIKGADRGLDRGDVVISLSISDLKSQLTKEQIRELGREEGSLCKTCIKDNDCGRIRDNRITCSTYEPICSCGKGKPIPQEIEEINSSNWERGGKTWKLGNKINELVQAVNLLRKK